MARKRLGRRKNTGRFDSPDGGHDSADSGDTVGVFGGPTHDGGLLGGPGHSSGLLEAPGRAPGDMPSLFDRPGRATGNERGSLPEPGDGNRKSVGLFDKQRRRI